jgi:hypothetical protein
VVCELMPDASLSLAQLNRLAMSVVSPQWLPQVLIVCDMGTTAPNSFLSAERSRCVYVCLCVLADLQFQRGQLERYDGCSCVVLVCKALLFRSNAPSLHRCWECLRWLRVKGH